MRHRLADRPRRPVIERGRLHPRPPPPPPPAPPPHPENPPPEKPLEDEKLPLEPLQEMPDPVSAATMPSETGAAVEIEFASVYPERPEGEPAHTAGRRSSG